jgi:Flp pilus assembly protein TadG
MPAAAFIRNSARSRVKGRRICQSHCCKAPWNGSTHAVGHASRLPQCNTCNWKMTKADRIGSFCTYNWAHDEGFRAMKVRPKGIRASKMNKVKMGWRFLHDCSGQELLEMAFILPFLLVLVVGIFWAARACNVYETVNRAAREGARVAVAPTCFACGNSFVSVSESTCTATDPVALAVINSLKAASLPCTSNPPVTVSIQPHQKLGDDATGSNTQWTVVTVTYPYKFYLPLPLLRTSGGQPYSAIPTINISATAQMVEEP